MSRVALAFAILLGGTAQAYVLKADVEGHPIRWLEMPVRYVMDAGGARSLDLESAERAVVASFEAWNELPEAQIELVYAGRVAGGVIGYDRTAPDANTNLVIWSRDAWNHEPEPLAITITTFRRGTGQLVDADIFINEQHHRWGEGAGAENDLQNAVTHEVGHFLGLAHSDVPEATMFASAAPHELSKRTLEADDRAGVAVIYPVTGRAARRAGDPPPANDDGAHRNDGVPADRASTTTGGVSSAPAPDVPHVGCSTAPGASPGPGALVVVLLLACTRRVVRAHPWITAQGEHVIPSLFQASRRSGRSKSGQTCWCPTPEAGASAAARARNHGGIGHEHDHEHDHGFSCCPDLLRHSQESPAGRCSDAGPSCEGLTY